MKNKNYIREYHKWLHSAAGKKKAGKWIRLWYDQVIDGLNNKAYTYDGKEAKKAITFIENFCRHHEGELAPGLIQLELWQKALVSVIFGILDKDGNRQFREIIIIIGRKAGKTLLAAAISAYCAYLDDDYGKRIYFTAPKLEQANLCYDAFFQMVQQEPELASLAKKRRTDIYIESSNTSIKPISFNAKKSDGFNISLAVCDEIASWKGDPGLKFYEVLKSSQGSRRQPLLLSISTAGYENEGIYDELFKRATRVLLGDSEEARLAPFIYQIDDLDKWDDLVELKKANPNLGISVPEQYMLDEIAIAKGSLSKATEFKVKYCNTKQNSSQAWLSTKLIESCSGDHLNLEDFRGTYCVGGIDLSQTRDLTAATAVIERDGELYVFAKAWLPAEKIEEAIERDGVPYNIYIERGLLAPSGDNYIDYHDCFRWFTNLVEKYQIYPLQVGYDRYSAQYLVQDMAAYGFHMDDVYQGDNLYGVMQEAQGIMEDGHLHIGDNDLLKMHFLDSAIKMNEQRGRGRLVKVKNYCHIDLMASFLDAMTVRQKHYEEIGVQLKNQR